MSVIYGYNSVPPSIIQRCQRDAEFLHTLGCEPEELTLPVGCRDLYIGKAWDAIVYLLSEERRAARGLCVPEDIFGQAVFGAEVLNPAVEVGYGPPTFLSPQAVMQAAAALDAVLPRDLKKHFKPSEMNAARVYPETWSEEGFRDWWSSIADSYKQFRTFYRDAAAAGHAVIAWCS
jgi:hypothetical protein